MPRSYPRLRNISGSIYQLILLHEIMRRYYENSQRPFTCSHEDICRSTGFSDADLAQAMSGIVSYVTCREEGGAVTWNLNLEYTRRMIQEISR